MSKISARLALLPEEKDFLIKIAAGLPQTEAYRRAFTDTIGGLTAAAIATKASRLAKQDYMVNALAEYTGDTLELAKQTYNDHLIMGTGSAVLGAANSIIQNEALQSAKTDAERFWLVAAACGAVVKTVVGDTPVTIPVKDLFPKFKEATPPPDVLAKTAKSLAEWYDKLSLKEQALDERDRNAQG